MDTQCAPARRRQMIVNWLGLAVLLGLGIVTGPAGVALAPADLPAPQVPAAGGR
ncbi:MAG: hypothetical protein JSR36_13020 [Proteobacteria bacterium]|nr:hypothetical protein [Pseudomonadota bacterium]